MSRFDEISKNLALVQTRIERAMVIAARDPVGVEMIAVTKNFPVSDAEILYALGLRNFGENRDDEGALKSEQLPNDIHWHFQGQVQGKKINSISSWADCIHSLDSLAHARKFTAIADSRESAFFLQINLEPERSDRGGIAPAQAYEFLRQLAAEAGIAPVGLMTVAPIEMDPKVAFAELKSLQDRLQEPFPTLTSLSMGMSGDFEAAIIAGTTHLRIGSSILGSRVVPA